MLMRSPAWPPDYSAERLRRHRLAVQILNMTPKQMRNAVEVYRRDPVAFINDWCETFDPRNAGTNKLTTMPFRLFPKQVDLVQFLHECLLGDFHGLIEKSRDMGATWVAVSFSVWMFCFLEGATVGWGSRKAAQVDKLGDMNSIFEKIRFQVQAVPKFFWPTRFDPANMMGAMKVYAPNGNAITGESGDDIGRGGRTRIYFKDESAHYERPEMIEAALGDTTRVQIDISSVNGLGNVFHRKREGGLEWTPGSAMSKRQTNVFVMDWSDHPGKSKAWYDEREAKAMEDGLIHLHRQEVDRDYASAVEGIIVPGDWVKSAIDAHVTLGFPADGYGMKDSYAGLDVADEGGDRNALAYRCGPMLLEIAEWSARDTAVSARKAIELLGDRRVVVEYDCIGVGAGVKAEINRLNDDRLMPKGITFTPWNAGAAVEAPDDHVDLDDYDTPINKDFYQNLKAQAWWMLRRRFERTHQAVQLIADGKPHKYNPADLISIPSTLPLLRTLQKELSQPTVSKSTKMKLLIDKKPPGTKSPNLADAVVMAFWPVDGTGYDTTLGWV